MLKGVQRQPFEGNLGGLPGASGMQAWPGAEARTTGMLGYQTVEVWSVHKADSPGGAERPEDCPVWPACEWREGK